LAGQIPRAFVGYILRTRTIIWSVSRSSGRAYL
jgi:hypothetical protein